MTLKHNCSSPFLSPLARYWERVKLNVGSEQLPLKQGLLSQIPPPPKGKTGWPWTKESPVLPDCMEDGSNWPKISIVTPSFNQGQFIEETIRSVLLQNYPNLEYIIIDGGSTDHSVEIIKKYEPWLTYWVSEKDRGQSHAINKGFKRSTGDIMNWLCSDDLLAIDCFVTVVERMNLNTPFWMIGGAHIINSKSFKIKTIPPRSHQLSLDTFVRWCADFFPQTSTFWNRDLWNRTGSVNENYHYIMDVDLWFRFYQITQPDLLNSFISLFRNHPESKTHSKQTIDAVLNEQAIWELTNIYSLHQTRELNEALIYAVMNLQRDIRTLRRIKTHPVLGVVLKQWQRWINPNLPV